jgi:hypothetical protein
MGPLAPKVWRFSNRLKRPQSTIQIHSPIECVETHLALERDMKSAAKKAIKHVDEGDAAGVDKSEKSKINFPI